MLRKTSVVLCLAATVILAGCTSKPVGNNSLKIGSLPMLASLPAYVAQQEGLFARHGVQLEIVPFRSTAELMSVLLDGKLDGVVGEVYWTVNLNMKGRTSKLVGSALMPRTFEVVASSQSGITTPGGLKGKEIAVATGTIVDYALESLLLAKGINPDNVTRVNIPSMPLRLEVLNQGKVPAAIFTRPLSDLAIISGGRVILADIEEPLAGPGLIFSLAALKNKTDTVSRCVQAWQEATDLINAEPAKYQALLNEIAAIPDSVDLKVPDFPRLGLPKKSSTDVVVNWFMTKDLIKEPIPYSEIVDTRYLSK